MHRIGNTSDIKPNWGALVPDDGPSLTLSVEATTSGATYVFRAFGYAFDVAFESKQGTFGDTFSPTSDTPTVLVPAGQSVSVPPGVGNVGIDDTVLPSEPGQSYTVRFQGTSGGTVVTGECAYTLPVVLHGVTLMPDETTLIFNVEANVACTIDYTITSNVDSLNLTNYWEQGGHNELVSSIDLGNTFEASSDLIVVAFCRLPLVQFGELNDSIRVRLWDDATQTVLHERLVGPGAYLNGNMRCETLETPIVLVQGKRYTISQVCIDGMADLWVYNYDSSSASTINGLVGTATRARFHDGIGFPNIPWANSWPSVGLLAGTPIEEGTLTLGNDSPLTAQHRFENLSPSTEYTCLYDVITPSTEYSDYVVATTLGEIDLSLYLRAHEQSILVAITVSVACSCEVVVQPQGDPDVAHYRTEYFAQPDTRVIQINDLTANTRYACRVVASAPNYVTTEQTMSIDTTLFPEVVKFEIASVASASSQVDVQLSGLGSVLIKNVAADDEDDRSDIFLTDTDTALFDGLRAETQYICTVISVSDENGNTRPGSTPGIVYTTEPLLVVTAALNNSPYPAGLTQLVGGYTINTAADVEMLLTNANNETIRSDVYGSVLYTQIYGVDEPLSPGSEYTLTIIATSVDEIVTATAVKSTLPWPPMTADLEPGDFPEGRLELLFNVHALMAGVVEYELRVDGNEALVGQGSIALSDSLSEQVLFTNLVLDTTYACNYTFTAPNITYTDVLTATTLDEPVPGSFSGYFKTGTRNNYTGEIGTLFVAANDLTVYAFGRMPTYRYSNILSELHEYKMVRLYDAQTQTMIRECPVGPGAYRWGTYRYENLDVPVQLTQGKTYVISQLCAAGMPDLWLDPPIFNGTGGLINRQITTSTKATYVLPHNPLGGYPTHFGNNNAWPIAGFLSELT